MNFQTPKIIKSHIHEPTKGEAYLCKLLDEYLPRDIEIYIQPEFDGNRPDIVLLNQKYGVFIIEVKDWKLERFYRKDGKFYKKFDNSQIQIADPKVQIERYYYRLAEAANIEKDDISLLLFFYNSNTAAVRNFLETKQQSIFGYDGALGFVKSFYSFRTKNLEQDKLDRLRKILKPYFHKREYGIEVKLNQQQKNLIEHKPNTWQRARGVAGSGKTFVIARRAANIASNGLRVLVVCYNKTLKNYIKFQIQKAYENFYWDCIDILHFHDFIGHFVGENDGDISFETPFDEWESKIIGQANQILRNDENRKQRQYDAILIDEAQDFKKEWFDLLTKFLSENNEILLMADDKQNVYERHISWLVDMKGFSGRWNELKASIRQQELPDIIIKANEFSNLFLKEYLAKNPDKTLGFELNLTIDLREKLVGFASLFWKDIFEINDETFNEIYKAYEYLTINGVENENIVILLPSVKMGDMVVKFLHKKGFEVEHTFEKWAKENFDLQSDKLKISTIESFKGLEMDAVIYVSDEQDNIKKDIETYIAITRAKSYLIVFNQTEKYRSYGAKWHKLDDEFKANFQ